MNAKKIVMLLAIVAIVFGAYTFLNKDTEDTKTTNTENVNTDGADATDGADTTPADDGATTN